MRWESEIFTYGSARQPPELWHYGIPKMRWHQRRFQNADGTLTPEGRERYRKKDSGDSLLKKAENLGRDSRKKSPTPEVKERFKKSKPAGSVKGATKGSDKNDRENWKAQDAKDLSDEELRKRNNRLQAEQNYKNNMTPQWKKEAKQTVKNWRNEAIKNIFIGTATTLLAAAMIKNYKKVGPVIAKASKVAVNKIRSSVKTNTRNTINNAVNKYSSSRNKTSREYDYRLGNRNGVRKSREWPTIPSKEKKKKG